MKTLINFAAASLVLVASHVSATVLTATTHVDNGYKIYISTSDSMAGTQFGTGDRWQTGFTNMTTLAAGEDYYLHIYAWDEGGIASALGQFSLSDTDHQFANGTQSLLTNSTDWVGNATGFNGNYTMLTDQGANGVGPWGMQNDIGASAHWIWFGDAWKNDYAYLTTKISATKISATSVPEPASLALLALGAAGMGAIRRRKQIK